MTDDEPKKRGRPPKDRSEVTSDLLATGEASMAQIAHLFRTDAKTLPRRLRRLRPVATRSGVNVYSIRDAAGYLTILLFPETVEREVGVTDAQRRIIRRLCDGLIDDLRKHLVEHFENYVPSPAAEQLQLQSSDGLGPIEDGDGILQAEDYSEDPDDI
jgi:hypothetical protein